MANAPVAAMHRTDGFGPLDGEDAAWLHMEDATNPMIVNGMIETEQKLDPARFRAIVERRILSLPRFRTRVVESAVHVGVPHWEPDARFEIDRHLEHVDLGPDPEALRTFVGRTVSQLLDRDRPLWRLYVLDRGSAGTVVLFRVHHAIADGFALLAVLISLCDEDDAELAAKPTVTHGTTPGGALRGAAALGRLVGLPFDPKTPLKQPLTRVKRVAWSRPIALDHVKSIARAASATVNDVLVAAVTGALREHLRAHGKSVREVRAMVPVNLRDPQAPLALGNRFGLVVLGLPVGIAEPAARVREVTRRMDRLKASPEAVVAHGLLRAMGWAPQRIEDLGVAFFGKKASLVLTNVPGPRTVLHLAGVPIRRVIFWVPQSARMGLGISIFSYAGEITVGVLADASVLEEPADLVDGIERELDRLG